MGSIARTRASPGGEGLKLSVRTAVKVAGIACGGLVLAAAVFFVAIGYHRQLQMFLPPRLDAEPPPLPPELGRPAVLVFSKTNGFRHHEGIPAAAAALGEIADARGWSIFSTENGAIFAPELLERFDVVVWSSATGRLLTDDQRAALRRFVEDGGGFVGIHAAGDDSHASWPWYADDVIRADFTMHPVYEPIQTARLVVEDREHPATEDLPAEWRRADEWYSFERSPRSRVRVLVSLDESTYDPEHVAMGADHPVVWCHELGRGRVFYTALGHTAEGYSDPHYRALLTGAIEWAGRLAASGDGAG